MKELLRGTGASKGIIRGRVRVIVNPKDVDKLKDNEILVAKFTNPLFTPAMLRAAGIVTDMGGILCHAAIIARELGIPCVTGTENATEILKNNMEVIIDGEKGIVSKGLSEDEMLDVFSDMIAKSLVTVGGKEETRVGLWPAPLVNLIEAVYYTMKYYPKIFLDLTKKLETKGYSDSEIAKLLKHPSRIAANLWPIQGKGLGQISKEELIEYTIKNLKYISLLRKSDLFCRDGINIILSNKEIVNELNKVEMINVNPKINSILSKLHATAWLYTELLYFANHAVGHEFHGPYQLENDEILIIREYFDLRVPEVWSFTSKLTFNHIKILEIYDKKTNVEFDIFNRTRTHTNISRYLKKFVLIVDGKQIKDKKEIENLFRELENVLKIGSQQMLKMNKKDLIKKVNEAAHFWVAKLLADELNIDWKPPKELYKDIEREEVLNSEFFKNFIKNAKIFPKLSEEKKIEIFKSIFDPRL